MAQPCSNVPLRMQGPEGTFIACVMQEAPDWQAFACMYMNILTCVLALFLDKLPLTCCPAAVLYICA
jgi:hypothetical protein